jgi:DNA (cytosine-5)-methyltransferase 1
MAIGGNQWEVVDLFSGAGGMSWGFHIHPHFRMVGAADAQFGKPSSGQGTLGCNDTYRANIGINPVEMDLSTADPEDVCAAMGLRKAPTVLSACPPCTGFSRTLAHNHLKDDARNSLVGHVVEYVRALRPAIVLMENARELIMGRFSGHLRGLLSGLEDLGYASLAETHFLNEFGLPQKRERALVVAVRKEFPLYTLADMWAGYRVNAKATHVRRAIWDLPAIEAGAKNSRDPMHVAPAMTASTYERMAAIPHDGGGWIDLVNHPHSHVLLTPSMKHRAEIKDFGSHPDVYGRMWWDKPAPTIKRECGHIGNGRYSHPEQNRLCTVREMAILQGFPRSYQFFSSLANRYRHIGDAVPPWISYQLATLAEWTLTGIRPTVEQWIMPDGHLTAEDMEPIPGA